MSWLDSKPADVVGTAIHALTKDPSSADILDYAGGDGRFGLWLYLVEKRSRTALGLSIFDLEDWHWHNAYDSGESPKEAFAAFIEDLDLDEYLGAE